MIRTEAAAPLADPVEKPCAAVDPVPLVVDLDGTLIRTDLLVESVLLFIKRHPLRLPFLLLWLLRGRAHLKRQIAAAVAIDTDLLPLRDDVIRFVHAQAASGRRIVLATASDETVARRVAARIGGFDQVLGSNGRRNLKAGRKAEVLAAQFPRGFDYIGDSAADLPVWAAARRAIFAGRSPRLAARLARSRKIDHTIVESPVRLMDWLGGFRIHQAAKNVLIFIPIILGGRALEVEAWLACLLGFFAMGLVASGTYVLNDLFDLEDDRRHWSKNARALASGRIPLLPAAAVSLLLILFGIAVYAAIGGPRGLAMILLYLGVSITYSVCLKTQPFADAIVLAGLFTIRIATGIVLAQVAWSAWLLVFSMFLFTSLSFAKRATEIARLSANGQRQAAGRGYLVVDGPAVAAFGISAGTSAVFVLVMYLIEEAFQANYYPQPAYLWAFPLALALWLGRVWLLCGRGAMADDPVVFALRDGTSLALGGMMLLAVVAARIG